MNDLYLVFVAGLLGSAHCLGMCGGFVIAINTAQDRSKGILHQLSYFGGKTLTYSILGAVAGAFGSALISVSGVQNALSILAGVLMVLIGFGLMGVLDRIRGFEKLTTLPGIRQAMGYFLRQRTLGGTFGLGLVNGLLPCGLVYGLLVKAAATGTLLEGALTMFVFGIATVPALFALGMTGHLVSPVWRSRLNYASGGVVLLLGMLTIMRGTPARAAVMSMITGGSHRGHEMHEMPPARADSIPGDQPMHMHPEH